MLAVGKSGLFSWQYSLTTTPTLTPGVLLTPASGSKGSYVVVCSGANMTNDCYWMSVWVCAGSTSATIRDIIIDIGTDPAGGTSYSQTYGINNLWVPQAAAANTGSTTVNYAGHLMNFPFFIPAGQSVAVRAQANNTSTVRCMVTLYGRPAHPEFVPTCQYVESLGNSGNGGTPVTCGNSAAEGSWTSLGTTTRPTWAWMLASGHNVGTITAQMYFFDLAWSNDATNYWPIITNQPHFNATTEITSSFRNISYSEVPAGATIYARGSASGTAETTECMAYGFGG
jgi:hypothetical protein